MKHPHIQKCRRTESDFLLHSLPAPQSREDTVNPILKDYIYKGCSAGASSCYEFQLEGQPSSLLQAEMGLLQRHPRNHLQESEEVSSLTAALPPIFPAQTKLMLVAYLFITVLPAHSLGCCQRSSEITWSLITDLVNSHLLCGLKSSEGRLALHPWGLKPISKLQSTDCLAEPAESALSQKVFKIEEE